MWACLLFFFSVCVYVCMYVKLCFFRVALGVLLCCMKCEREEGRKG